MSNDRRLDRLRSYGTSVLAERPGLESTATDESVEAFLDDAVRWSSRDAGAPPPAAGKDQARTAYKSLQDPSIELAPTEMGALEAIILPALRPVGDVAGGKFTLPVAGEFGDFLTDPAIRDRLETALQSIGCVVLPGHPQIPYGGTGVVVGKGLVMTNRHVAQIFTSGLGTRGLRLSSTFGPALDPLREVEGADEPAYEVKAVKMIHPFWDMALLEVPDLPNPPIAVDPVELGGGSRRRVAVIGYPAFDVRSPPEVQMAVFRRRFSVKRIAPGYVNGYSSVRSFGNLVSAMIHDASTLGGNSGSAIVDVRTGHVLALHFAGVYLDRNYSVPAAELAKDGRVIDAGMTFTEDRRAANVSWDAVWTTTESSVVEAVPVAIGPAAIALTATAPVAIAPVVIAPSASPAAATLQVTIPIELTIQVGHAVSAAAAVTTPAITVTVPANGSSAKLGS